MSDVFRCQVDTCRQQYITGDSFEAGSQVLSAAPSSIARSVGWLVWEGLTLSGKQVTVTVCPKHNSKSSSYDETAVDVGDFDAICHTCNCTASEEWEDAEWDGSREMAEEWMDEHQCEPDVRLISPKEQAA